MSGASNQTARLIDLLVPRKEMIDAVSKLATMACLQERRALRNENGDSAETAVVFANVPPPTLSQKKCSDCFIFS